MEIFRIIILIINTVLFIHSLYFGVLAVLPFLTNKKEKKISNKNHIFRVLIAARNEELVLKPLIDSIKKQNYDHDKIQIYVLPNNCTDNTKQVAIDLGCSILEPYIKTKTKGEVLNFAFDKFKNDNTFDTYVIFDADNVLDKNFFKEMNNKLNEGYKIIQGFRDTKNLYQNCISGSYALFFYLQSLFVYETRRRIGEGCSINGTGYAVLKSYIDNINYRAKTSTEDIELTTVSAINREKIGYSRKAIFYDEQVVDFKTSMKQRKRWIQGSMQVWKNYRKSLFKEIIKQNNFQLTEDLFVLTLPINQAIAFPLLVLTYIFVLPINIFLVSILIGFIGEVLTAFLLIIYFKKNIKKMIPAILFFPIFHLSWVPIYIYSIFNSKNIWEEIKHTRVLDIDEIEN